jgi:cobalt-zinc-cadmium efflux system protein
MAHGHDHAPAAKSSRALTLALGLTATYTVVEIVGGVLTGSLALLADAVHMVSDNVAIALALFAVWLGARPSTPERTFGYRRAEVLAALANGMTLVALSIWIFYAAITRLDDPPDVLGGWMLAIAVAGVAVNVASGVILHGSRSGNLNVEAAFRHVVADVLGSLGVIVAALTILLTGWLQADPVVSILIGVLIVASSWTILRDSTSILLEAAPRDVDTRAVGERLAGAPGVVDVHDLHIWTITSGFPALSAHVLVGRGEDCHARRRELETILAREFSIEHTTLQVDHAPDPSGLVELGRFWDGSASRPPQDSSAE